MRLLLLFLLSVSCDDPSVAADVDVAPPAARGAPPIEGLVAVSDGQRGLALPLADATLALLAARDWDPAATALLRVDPAALGGSQRGDWAFVTSWALSHAGRAAEAERLLPMIAGADSVPEDFAALVEGEVLRAAKRPLEALDALARVPESSEAWPRAAVQRAEVLKELGRRSEGFEVYQRLAARPDPSPGTDVALLALAERAGVGSAGAYVYLRRLWAAYPGTDATIEGSKLLAQYTGDAAFKPTFSDVTLRGERLMDQWRWDDAIAAMAPFAAQATKKDAETCRFRYAYGRSLYKRNKLTDSVAVLATVGADCATVAPDVGAPAQYLVGTAEMRRKRYAESAAAFRALADLYPATTYADDGLTHAGIALQELGRNDDARATWLEGLERFPDGDTIPESTWRVAWTSYVAGDTAEALRIAEKLAALPLASDHEHVAAGRYWMARWRLYPDFASPNRASTAPADRDAAVAGWRALCEDLPHSFYSILAYSRLVEVAPDVAAALAKRPANHDVGKLDAPWQVRAEVLANPRVSTGVQLARVGLSREAMVSWEDVDLDALTGEEMAWLTELRIAAGDWLFAHRWLRDWLKSHPSGTHGDGQPRVLRIAYPDRYWSEVQSAAAGYRYEPRLFHALCREESDFNVQIRSHAGAMGLSQLMPRTADEVARWFGMKITTAQLVDPALNAKLGSRYLDQMHKQLGDSPYLALAAYNGGAGNVRKWHDEWGALPTDEYVERIPFRETRGYVKRVMGTWQTMRFQFDTSAPAFPDLSAYNHVALKP